MMRAAPPNHWVLLMIAKVKMNIKTCTLKHYLFITHTFTGH